MKSQVATLQSQIATLQGNSSLALNNFVRVDYSTINGVKGPHVIFEGANVHVRSGAGSTYDAISGIPSGLGNLIVGYNEVVSDGPSDRYGSHTLVVGSEHVWMDVGGFVAGYHNNVQGRFSSILGGYNNTAFGVLSTVSGGANNMAGGNETSILGGDSNRTLGDTSVVAGGITNHALATYSSILGGANNTINQGGERSTILGGSGLTLPLPSFLNCGGRCITP